MWYFGENAGVNFNTNPPTSLQDGAMDTPEGCATLTDGQGNLLMYTNGSVIFNRLHQQMPNGFGLWGDPSSFQSVTFVPQPGSDSLVYAFIVEDCDGSPQRFSYSIIDLTADNGLPGPDIAGAKALLAEAGYPNGLTVKGTFMA
ncbi:MAG: hypothetical protein EOO03_15550 [Chitinophagaceae bacterium]|nr:MAG: hypothetical protein EOO03_15550 [Chitinophagaceae bacterium]